MTQKSEACPQPSAAVDYQLVSDDTGHEVKIPKRIIPPGAIVLPRWSFYLLVGFAGLGFVAVVMLTAAVVAFVG